MTPEEIRALLQDRGATQSAIAKVAGVTPTSVSRVIEGTDKSRRIANLIAEFLELPIDTLWPGKYPAKYVRRASDEAMARLSAALERTQRAAA